MSTIGERMRELRGPSTLREMADPIGIKYNAWARYEAGGSIPGGDIIVKICRAHACSADWLLGLSDNDQKTSRDNDIHNCVKPGEGAQCLKCPYKKKLKAVEKALK